MQNKNLCSFLRFVQHIYNFISLRERERKKKKQNFMNGVVVYSLQQWKRDSLGGLSRMTLDNQAYIDIPRSNVCINNVYVKNLYDVVEALYSYMPCFNITLMLTQIVHYMSLKELYEEYGNQFVMSHRSSIEITTTTGGRLLKCTATVGQTPFIIQDGEIKILYEQEFNLVTSIENGVVCIYTEKLNECLFKDRNDVFSKPNTTLIKMKGFLKL